MTTQNARSRRWTMPAEPMMPIQAMKWPEAALLIAGYVLLDWVSYLHPLYGLNITPWSPASALGLVGFLHFGWVAAIPVAVAIFLADLWVRDLPASVPVVAALALLLAGGYGLIGQLLRRRLRSPGIFGDRRGLLEWAAIVVAGTLLISVLFMGALAAAGLIPGGDWTGAALRYWIGDAVGVLVTMPLIWMLASGHGRQQLRAVLLSRDTLAHLAMAAIALWIAFGIGPATDFKHFYVLVLPIVWAAARQGLPGAVLLAAVVQVGVIVGVEAKGFAAISIFEVQTLSVVLALLGFFVGVVMDEQRRLGRELRQSLRLAAAGEMAGALAHELNQPLTALAAYGSAAETLIRRGDSGEQLQDAIRRMVAESSRAAEVVHRLRDFFLTGSTRLERVALADLVRAAAAPFLARAQDAGVRMSVEPMPVAVVLGDRLQLEVVIRNLLANAFDAVAARPAGERTVRVFADLPGVGRVSLRVEDSGEGLRADDAARLFEPFRSTKSSGMGLGLAISRAIAEAHGGELAMEAGSRGAFRLVLPVEDAGRA